MHNPTQHCSGIFEIRRRVAGATLALATVLVPAIVATGSAQAQNYSYSQLYSFTGAPDGAGPVAALVLDGQGNLYGTTSAGGGPACGFTGGCGTVFKLNTSGKETVLHSFTGGDGADPEAGLVLDTQGNLYGTTYWGGDLFLCGEGCGTVFKLDTTGKEAALHSFTYVDGSHPEAGLVRDAQGNLYGATRFGGYADRGTVFKVDTTGKEIVISGFAKQVDGVGPTGGLVRDAQGNLYGTTQSGGAYHGVVFKVDTTGKETVLYAFLGKLHGDGATPRGVVQDTQGNLYGTTVGGGAFGKGTVFKVDPTGKETVLYSFTGKGGDGNWPSPGLVQDAQGNLYGTTRIGGIGYGTVFKLDTTGKETVLHRFSFTPDGADPLAGLVLDAQSNLYGTTSIGGADNYGTVFKLTPTP